MVLVIQRLNKVKIMSNVKSITTTNAIYSCDKAGSDTMIDVSSYPTLVTHNKPDM